MHIWEQNNTQNKTKTETKHESTIKKKKKTATDNGRSCHQCRKRFDTTVGNRVVKETREMAITQRAMQKRAD